MPLKIAFGDITKVNCDAIVNFIDESSRYNKLDGKIYHSSEISRFNFERSLNACKVKQYLLTPSAKSSASYIINTVAPKNTIQNYIRNTADCYNSAVSFAKKKGLISLAFPLLPSDNKSVPVNLTLMTAITALLSILKNSQTYLSLYLILEDDSYTECFYKNISEKFLKDNNIEIVDIKKNTRLEFLKSATKHVDNQKTEKSAKILSNSKATGLKSVVFEALIYSGSSFGHITVVKDLDEQDGEKGVYWINRSFSMKIIIAAKNSTTAIHDGVEYEILSYDAKEDLDKYTSPTHYFNNPIEPQTVFVFAHKNIPYYEQDNYESVSALIPCKNSLEPALATVFYEKSTKMYFINETVYKRLRHKYGLPYLHITTAQTNGDYSFANLKTQSELNLLGYSVNADSSNNTKSRQILLADIIDSKMMTKQKIINHLEWLIDTREYMEKMQNAVGEWKQDLDFVYNYKVNTQRKIWCTNFKLKY